jgi:hypothetical protein
MMCADIPELRKADYCNDRRIEAGRASSSVGDEVAKLISVSKVSTLGEQRAIAPRMKCERLATAWGMHLPTCLWKIMTDTQRNCDDGIIEHALLRFDIPPGPRSLITTKFRSYCRPVLCVSRKAIRKLVRSAYQS